MLTSRSARYTMILAALLAIGGSGLALRAWACPFCSAVSQTFSEEIGNSQVAVIAKLVEPPPKSTGANSLDAPKAKFEIVQILKGGEHLGTNRKIETVFFGDGAAGSTYLMMGIDPPNLNWSTPIAISERGPKYIADALLLPKEGGDRLAYFQDYLEDKDDMLARDAFDEFAKAPYAGVVDLKSRMKHDQLVEWIKNPQIPVSRRRLYITMLGICGSKADVPMLEELIKSKDRQAKGALDALVAAYLTLDGPDGMPLVEDLFLKNKDAEYTDTWSTIMALRFHGTEEKVIPRERLLAAIRTMLDRPQLADLVIPDLARWEDWSVMDRLVELFKNADEESSWVRVPVITYLRACPLPKAKEYVAELAKIDPGAVERANSFYPLAATGTATSAEKPAGTPDTKNDKAATPPITAANLSGGSTGAVASNSSADSSTPSPALPPSNVPIFVGLAAAAAMLTCAFWAILKGGQSATS